MTASIVNTPPPTDAELEAAGWVKIEETGFIELVGPLWRRAEPDGRYCFVSDSRHRNTNGFVQGGMIATFADRSLGHTVRLGNHDRRQATVQLDVRFIEGTPIGVLVEARCQVKRRTGSLAFVDAEIIAGSRTVAAVSGIWKIMSAAKP
jgi:acyl-coenzyme A thioesterase PaaI-like protein